MEGDELDDLVSSPQVGAWSWDGDWGLAVAEGLGTARSCSVF